MRCRGLIVLLSCRVILASDQCREDQEQNQCGEDEEQKGALVAFIGDSTQSFSWSGVKCNSKGRVVSIEFDFDTNRDSTKAHGGLHNLTALTCLRNLTLVEQLVFGNLEDLNSLQYLRNLTLRRTPNIAGKVMDLTRIRSLSYLYLGGMISISGDLEEFKNMRALTRLNLARMPSITGNLESLKGMQKLEELRFWGLENVFGNISAFENLTQLTKLKLAGLNKVFGHTRCFRELRRLTELQLDSLVNVSGHCENFREFKDLVSLRVYTVNIQGRFKRIGHFTKLKVLAIYYTAVSGGIAGIRNLPNLEVLRLDSNLLKGTIPTEIGHIKGLKILILGRNPLEGTLPTELIHLPELSALHVAVARLEGTLPLLPTTLATLNVCRNKLKGQIPDLTGLSNLRNLILSDNFFHGGFPLLALGNGTNVLVHGNYLSGTIPPALETVKISRVTGIPGNNIEVPVPSWFADAEVILDKRKDLDFLNHLSSDAKAFNHFLCFLVSLGGVFVWIYCRDDTPHVSPIRDHVLELFLGTWLSEQRHNPCKLGIGLWNLSVALVLVMMYYFLDDPYHNRSWIFSNLSIADKSTSPVLTIVFNFAVLVVWSFFSWICWKKVANTWWCRCWLSDMRRRDWVIAFVILLIPVALYAWLSVTVADFTWPFDAKLLKGVYFNFDLGIVKMVPFWYLPYFRPILRPLVENKECTVCNHHMEWIVLSLFIFFFSEDCGGYWWTTISQCQRSAVTCANCTHPNFGINLGGENAACKRYEADEFCANFWDVCEFNDWKFNGSKFVKKGRCFTDTSVLCSARWSQPVKCMPSIIRTVSIYLMKQRMAQAYITFVVTLLCCLCPCHFRRHFSEEPGNANRSDYKSPDPDPGLASFDIDYEDPNVCEAQQEVSGQTRRRACGRKCRQVCQACWRPCRQLCWTFRQACRRPCRRTDEEAANRHVASVRSCLSKCLRVNEISCNMCIDIQIALTWGCLVPPLCVICWGSVLIQWWCHETACRRRLTEWGDKKDVMFSEDLTRMGIILSWFLLLSHWFLGSLLSWILFSLDQQKLDRRL